MPDIGPLSLVLTKCYDYFYFLLSHSPFRQLYFKDTNSPGLCPHIYFWTLVDYRLQSSVLQQPPLTDPLNSLTNTTVRSTDGSKIRDNHRLTPDQGRPASDFSLCCEPGLRRTHVPAPWPTNRTYTCWSCNTYVIQHSPVVKARHCWRTGGRKKYRDINLKLWCTLVTEIWQFSYK